MEATRGRLRCFGKRRKRPSHSLLFSKATLQATLHRNRSDKTSIRVIRNDSRFPRPDALTPGSSALTLGMMGSIPRYPRSYGSRINWGGMLTPAIRNIVIICTGVFLVQTLLRLFAPLDVTGWYLSELGLVPLAVTHGLRLWQPVTYLFLHDVFSFWHLL